MTLTQIFDKLCTVRMTTDWATSILHRLFFYCCILIFSLFNNILSLGRMLILIQIDI